MQFNPLTPIIAICQLKFEITEITILLFFKYNELPIWFYCLQQVSRLFSPKSQIIWELKIAKYKMYTKILAQGAKFGSGAMVWTTLVFKIFETIDSKLLQVTSLRRLLQFGNSIHFVIISVFVKNNSGVKGLMLLTLSTMCTVCIAYLTTVSQTEIP